MRTALGLARRVRVRRRREHAGDGQREVPRLRDRPRRHRARSERPLRPAASASSARSPRTTREPLRRRQTAFCRAGFRQDLEFVTSLVVMATNPGASCARSRSGSLPADGSSSARWHSAGFRSSGFFLVDTAQEGQEWTESNDAWLGHGTGPRGLAPLEVDGSSPMARMNGL